MANYIVSAPDSIRQIKTNTSGLTKSIQTLLDEGYESVTVIPAALGNQLKQPKFKIGDKVRIIYNTVNHGFEIAVSVIITDVQLRFDGKYVYKCSGYTNGKPDWWMVYENDLESI